MTWPSSDVVRTNADATGDSPQSFRADVLDLIDKFNLLRNHVTTFVQGLLSAANAAAARTTLGAAILGANNDITSLTALTAGGLPNNSVLTANIAALQVTLAKLETLVVPLGVGQTWQNMTASRAGGITYTNSSGRPIRVMVTNQAANSYEFQLNIDGAIADRCAYNSSSGPGVHTLSAVVPSGSTYSLTITAGVINKWYELRA